MLYLSKLQQRICRRNRNLIECWRCRGSRLCSSSSMLGTSQSTRFKRTTSSTSSPSLRATNWGRSLWCCGWMEVPSYICTSLHWALRTDFSILFWQAVDHADTHLEIIPHPASSSVLWCRYILASTSQGCVHKYVNNFGSTLGLLLLLRRSWMFVACLRFWSGDRTIFYKSQWHWRPFPEPLRMEYRYKYLDNVIMLALRAHMYLDNGHHILQVLDRSDPSLLLTCWNFFCWQRWICCGWNLQQESASPSPRTTRLKITRAVTPALVLMDLRTTSQTVVDPKLHY